jgi:hypothetical protein
MLLQCLYRLSRLYTTYYYSTAIRENILDLGCDLIQVPERVSSLREALSSSDSALLSCMYL